MDKILELRRKAAALVSDARKLLDSKEKLSTEEETRYTTMMTDVMEMKKNIERQERQLELDNEMRQSADADKDTRRDDPADAAKGWASKAYRSAFSNYLRSGIITPELRDLQVNVDNKGGFLIAPEQMATELLKNVDDQVVIASLATIDTIQAGGSLGIQTLRH